MATMKRTLRWAELVEKQPDLIREYNDLCNQLGLAFRPAQQEAYELWCTWEEEIEEADSQEIVEEETSRTASVLTAVRENVEKARKFVRRPVESWAEPIIAVATPSPSASKRHKLSVPSEELSVLGLQPRLRIDIRMEQEGPRVGFMIAPPDDLDQLNHIPEVQKGTIHIRLIRPVPKQTIAVALGSRVNGGFQTGATRTLPDYEEGEELHWEVEISVNPGATLR